MPPVGHTDLSKASSCRVCGKQLPDGGAVCAACGAAQGESQRCPHCQAVADVEPHAALGFRCLVCGGPRLALGAELGSLSPGIVSALRSAGHEQTRNLMYTAAGALLTAMGALGLVIAAVVVLASSPGIVPATLAFLGAAVPVAAGTLALVRAARARALRGGALQQARLAAVIQAQRQLPDLDATRAASLLRLSPEQAELLLAEASVATLLEPEPRRRVEDAAQGSDEGVGDARHTDEPARGRTEI